MISILFPTYNSEATIGISVSSVLNQTYRKYELLILDDGSNDRTEEIVSKFNDERIKYHKLPHQGLPKTLNYGLSISQYDIIARMDADDIALPERFDQQYTYLQNNKDIGVLGTAYQIIEDDGKAHNVCYFPLTDRDIKNALPVLVAIPHCSVMYRKEVVKKVGGYRNDAFPVEDLDLWLRLYDTTSFANLDQVLLNKHKTKSSVTLSKSDEVKRTLTRIANEFIESRLNNILSESEKLHLLIQSARIQYYYGSLQKARMDFLKLLIRYPYNLQLWRYFLPSLIPERLFWTLRKNGLFKFITEHFRGKNRKSKYSL